MESKPAIVICAFNRPASLARLLDSISMAIFNQNDIELVISIDKGSNGEVGKLAEDFVWKHGAKKIITRDKHLGLKAHIFECGELTSITGSIIMLEDDLMVSPYFYLYAQQAHEFYNAEEKLAGISLYNYQVAESSFYPFKAIDDGSDVYFMQVASSWGQVWTRRQWTDFKTWFYKNPELSQGSQIPSYIKDWGANSWKKHFIQYLVKNNKYFVFPRLSLTTNFEDPGTNALTRGVFQVVLQTDRSDYHFKNFKESKSVYDAWFEILPACLNKHIPLLARYNYSVDLHGTKDARTLSSDYLLTSKKSDVLELSFGMELFPFENNVVLKLKGSKIGLYKLAGKVFHKTKLDVRNFLDEVPERQMERYPGLSIVIPVENFIAEDFEKTMESARTQDYRGVEYVVVSRISELDAVEKMLSYYKIDLKIIRVPDTKNLSDLIESGINNSTKEIITWLRPGSTFEKNSFSKAGLIFASYQNINWIRGISDETDKIAVRKVRLSRVEVYKRLLKNELDVSTELDFFKRNCVDALKIGKFSFAEFFLELIGTYQLIPVVLKLGTKKDGKLLEIKPNERDEILSLYKNFQKKPDIKSRAFSFVLKLFFTHSDLRQVNEAWVNDFPDVLRYDEKHNSFYFNKY
jgi:hypothetical protein